MKEKIKKVDRRKQELCDILAVYPELSISDVVEKMKISEATARRLFTRLNNEKIIIRTHGGIKKSPELNMAYSYDLSITQNRQKKRAIGKYAAGKVEDGDKIFMDSGSTILMFGEALSERMVAGELKNVTIVTNSLVYIEKLADLCRILLIGGEIRVQRRDVCGSSAEKNLSEYHFDHAFLGADSVSDEFGIMTTDELTANMNRVVIHQSKSSHVLSASNKFGRTSFVTYAQANEITSIITDAEIKKEHENAFTQQGLTLEIVSTGTE
jgi:DeoR family transcriptional regulator, fructose operon transcriptional repressor